MRRLATVTATLLGAFYLLTTAGAAGAASHVPAGTWHTGDLSVATGAIAASHKSSPAAFVLTAHGGTEHVIYIGTDNDLHELYWNGAWHTDNLSAITHAVAAMGDPVADVDATTDIPYIYYLGTDHHIHELWLSGFWHTADLTLATGTPVAGSSPDAYDYRGTQHVDYVAADGEVRELYFNGGAWHANDLTTAAGSTTEPAAGDTAPTAYADGTAQDVAYLGIDSDVHLLTYNGHWAVEDLTALTHSSTVADCGDRMDAYVWFARNSQHIDFVGSDNDIHELWSNGTWHTSDLTAAAHALPTFCGSNTSGYVFVPQSTQHIDYIGADLYVHELWFNTSWHSDSPAVGTGAPIADSNPVGYIFSHGGRTTQHVDYIGYDGDVHELWWG